MIRRVAWSVIVVVGCSMVSAQEPSRLPHVKPAKIGLSAERLNQIAPMVDAEIEKGNLSGCVVAIGRSGHIGYLESFGHRQIEPAAEPMTNDTVFDLASLTKPIATATSVMILVDRGIVRLRDPVARYLPEFGVNGKDKITVHQLLTHQGGLIPDNALRDYDEGREKAIENVMKLGLRAAPGEKFIYTDVGFIVLALMVERMTGKDVHQFSQEAIFQPLGMVETGYLPGDELRKRAEATERRGGQWMKGEVHDPRAFRMGGVAGHAGLFSTAEDLAVYADMMLSNGAYGGRRILSPAAVRHMTAAYDVPGGQRGLGWDKRSGYSSNRGEFMSAAAFGHGGFTGTAIWIDPELDLFVIFLGNRLHPDGKGTVNRLAGRIGTVACGAIQAPQAAQAKVHTGIDVISRDGFASLRGKRVGLITNQTAIDREGRHVIEVFAKSDQVDLRALFSPEHGLEGKLDIPRIASTREKTTGLTVHSLYGATRTPTAEMLNDIDVLVFDIQDIGTRFYTYISTMGLAMQAAEKHQLPFVVLDRPNPINGVDVAGPVLDSGSESFVGFHTLPVRHGMTVGEIARLFQTERFSELKLQVVPIEGWERGMMGDETGLYWVNPSPNMRTLHQALLYPGVGLLETTNISVGRGTDTPFEVVGAPWIEATKFATWLNQQKLSGVRFTPIRFTPDASKYKNEPCEGIRILITDRSQVKPLEIGFTLATGLRQHYRDSWDTRSLNRLLSDAAVHQAILDGHAVPKIMDLYQEELRAFGARREKVLLYE